jgi:hypothetical protein
MKANEKEFAVNQIQCWQIVFAQTELNGGAVLALSAEVCECVSPKG